jgi:hypothetical protein
MQKPDFRFFVSGEKKAVSTDSGLWKRSVMNPEILSSKENPSCLKQSHSVTVGDYFTAAQHFLSRDDFYPLRSALQHCRKNNTGLSGIQQVRLHLEKHGAFYHPVKVSVILAREESCSFVLNGAVSEKGLALLQNEYRLLNRLNLTPAGRFLPRVFDAGSIDTAPGKIAFFLGEWCEGFNEFHLTEDNARRQVVIWKDNGACEYIEQEDAWEIYRTIASILTQFYDGSTFEQIFPWHHAAGDFIIRRNKTGYDVRLITVRGYDNLTDFDPKQADGTHFILPALMLFFVQMCLRIRLDRINGTGDPVLIDEAVIPFVAEGFCQGLEKISASGEKYPGTQDFKAFMRSFGLEQLMEITANALEPLRMTGPELNLIFTGFESHVKKVFSVLKTL